jgi:integrase
MKNVALRWRFRKTAAHLLFMTKKDRLDNIFRIDAITFAPLRQLDPDLPEMVWEIIIRYRPRLPANQWEAVREFAISNAIQMKPRTFEVARRLMTMSARFTAWVWTTSGIELTPERVYTENNVYRYLQACLTGHSESQRWGIVRQLAIIALVLTGKRIAPMPSLKRRTSLRPFTPAEVVSLHSWAASLTTELKRHNAWALLGLAGGAGLRSSEIIDARIGDVEIIDGRVFANVRGENARRVPVRHPWSNTLLRAVEGHTDPDEYFFNKTRVDEYRPRIIQTFLTDNPGMIRATAARLRNGWIVTQIDNGLPASVLITIAGVKHLAALTHHMPHTLEFDVNNYLGLIIGEEVAR